MSAQFRVGDRVKSVAERVYPEGLGTVTVLHDRDLYPIGVVMDDDPDPDPWFMDADELELVEAAPINVPAIIACTECGEPIEPDDGGAIWYHADTMETWCGPVRDSHGGLDPQATPPEPSPFDMPSPEADALDRVLSAIEELHALAITAFGRGTDVSPGAVTEVTDAILRETGRL